MTRAFSASGSSGILGSAYARRPRNTSAFRGRRPTRVRAGVLRGATQPTPLASPHDFLPARKILRHGGAHGSRRNDRRGAGGGNRGSAPHVPIGRSGRNGL